MLKISAVYDETVKGTASGTANDKEKRLYWCTVYGDKWKLCKQALLNAETRKNCFETK